MLKKLFSGKKNTQQNTSGSSLYRPRKWFSRKKNNSSIMSVSTNSEVQQRSKEDIFGDEIYSIINGIVDIFMPKYDEFKDTLKKYMKRSLVYDITKYFEDYDDNWLKYNYGIIYEFANCFMFNFMKLRNIINGSVIVDYDIVGSDVVGSDVVDSDKKYIVDDVLLFKTLYVMISDHIFDYDYRYHSALRMFRNDRNKIKYLADVLYKEMDYIPCSIHHKYEYTGSF